MPETIVLCGKTIGGRWLDKATPAFPEVIREMPLEQAAREVAEHFNCTEQDAVNSLVKYGYASEPNRHWAIKTDKIRGEYDRTENGVVIYGDRW